MDTHQLMFELSHPVRFAILQSVSNAPQRMTRICELVDANSPEVSRHLERLKSARLVEKEPEGAYRITSLGKMTLALLPGMTFIAHNDDFFREHDLSELPFSFIATIGDLLSGEHEDGVFRAIQHGVKIVERAGERIYLITNESSSEFNNVLPEKHSKGLDIRYILDIDFPFASSPPAPWNPDQSKNTRVYDRVPGMCCTSEKEAAICFRNRKGDFDFQSAFFSTDELFVKWVTEFFEYLWDRSMLLDEFLDSTNPETSNKRISNP